MKFQDGRHASFKPESRVRRRNASSLRNADCCHGKLSNLMQRGAILETISSPPTRCISHVPARDTRPSYPRFRHVKILLSGTLSCAKTDDERSIEWVESSPSATELTRGHVQEFIIPPSALRRHDDGGAVNILWVDEARVGCSWTVDEQICKRS